MMASRSLHRGLVLGIVYRSALITSGHLDNTMEWS